MAGSAESRNKYMYIKEIINQILGINSINAHRKEFGVGEYQCLMDLCSLNQTYTKFMTSLARGALSTNLLDE